ncbi:hypothetical protein C8J57DRAFT_1500910 [Mycena rebaudengoi]|nr:hypothetical protein C8J57DRAFT_1500910 [Mycena rebaudengoi]
MIFGQLALISFGFRAALAIPVDRAIAPRAPGVDSDCYGASIGGITPAANLTSLPPGFDNAISSFRHPIITGPFPSVRSWWFVTTLSCCSCKNRACASVTSYQSKAYFRNDTVYDRLRPRGYTLSAMAIMKFLSFLLTLGQTAQATVPIWTSRTAIFIAQQNSRRNDANTPMTAYDHADTHSPQWKS